MAYYIRTRRSYSPMTGPTRPLWRSRASSMLHLDADPYYRYKRVDGITAHRWVRYDLHHTTPLWVDGDNRIRYFEGAQMKRNLPLSTWLDASPRWPSGSRRSSSA